MAVCWKATGLVAQRYHWGVLFRMSNLLGAPKLYWNWVLITLKPKVIATAFQTGLGWKKKGMVLLPGWFPYKTAFAIIIFLLLVDMNRQVLCQNAGLLLNHIKGLLYISKKRWHCTLWILKQRARMLLTYKTKIKQTPKAAITLNLTFSNSGKGRILLMCLFAAFLSLCLSQEK